MAKLPKTKDYDPLEGQDPLFDPWTDPATVARMEAAIAEGLADIERGDVVEMKRDDFRRWMKQIKDNASRKSA